jgi:hypothetical protein
MQKLKKLNKILCTFLLCIVIIKTQAQTGLNFQGVARTSNNIILASQPISLRLSILQGSATGIAEYVETRRVNTNAQGLFTAVIGDTGSISTLGNFSTINWKNTPKFLKIEMDPAAGNNFIAMGTTQFQYVAYAQFARSVDAENINGIVPVGKGGTGVASLASLKSTLALDKVNNTADTDKPISAKTQTALDLKLNAEDTSKYAKQIWTDSALLTKINSSDTIKYVKKTYADSSLLTKLRITDTAAMLSNRIGKDTLSLSYRINLKANLADFNNINTTLSSKLNLADTIKYTKQTYTDSSLLTKLKISDTAAMLSNRIGKDTLNLSARINAKANTSDVTTSLAQKENTSNKSSAADLGGLSPSDELYPTQKAVKAYVTANASSGGVADGGITTIKLADGAVTDAKLGTGISKSKVGLGNVENISINTWAGTSSLTTVGTITSGTWSGTIIDYSKLGLNNKIVNSDIVDSTITMQKLGISKVDLTNLGLAAYEEVVVYQAGQGLTQTTTSIPNEKRGGLPLVTTTFDLFPVNTYLILDEAVTDAKIATGISKSKVGLSNVDNTSDLNKPISTATQTALDLKANTSDLTTALGLKADLNSPTFTGTVAGITKTMIGLGDVDNTSDASKPISTAMQSALNLKANASEVTTSLAAKAPLNSPTFTGTVSGITKAMVGLGNVDNTSDALKPISTAMQNALNLMANASEVTTSLAAKAPLNSPTFTGTVSGITKSMVGLGNVDNTADASKPISTATQTALDLKAPLNSPTFTGTVSGITKSMVGLGNVDNTADASKPISTATQTALDLKAPLESPTFTGTVSGITKSMVGLGNVENTVLSTWAGSTSLTTLGTVTSGTWQGTRLTVPFGGTGQTTLAANSVLLGNGTSGMLAVAPGTSGNVLSSNGTTWVSAAPGAASAGTLTGNTLASNVLTSSLTSVGTLTSLSSGSITSSGKVIVGSNTASTSSAVLEANSTSQGFLPPRMTAAQKNAISNPVPGLMLWCTNCGVNGELQIFSEDNTWKNLSGNTAAVAYTPAVGESYRGGIVAYVLQSGDPGYEASTPHGIIAATVDQSTSTGWASTNATLTQLNNGTGLGTGLANTNRIIAADAINNAAVSATAYNGGGYTDWYLPSQEEIRKLYGIRSIINFSGFYWTSSEAISSSPLTHAVYVRTDAINSNYDIGKKYATSTKVRAIRSF